MITKEHIFIDSTAGINIDALAENAYAQVCSEAELPRDYVATNGYCVDCSVPMIKQLNVQFEASESDFRAWGGIYDVDDYMDHCYTSVYTPEGSPLSDIIIDLNL